MAKKKRITKKDLDAIERAVKREAQKAAGALDGQQPRGRRGEARGDR